jgi:DNA-binding NarL/FixJ family response regulator
MQTKCRVVIAEDHTIVREGLRALLLASPDFEIVAEAENGCEVIQRANDSMPNLILMDLSMPSMNGIEAIREIRSQHPQIKILVLTVHTNEEYIHACIQNGANGYIVKDASCAELIAAIRNVLAGKTHFCSEATEKIVTWYLHGTRELSRHQHEDRGEASRQLDGETESALNSGAHGIRRQEGAHRSMDGNAVYSGPA